MILLALDLGTQLGWCRAPTPPQLAWESGVENLKPKPHESPGMRFIRARALLNDLLFNVDTVCFEKVARHKGTQAAHIYGGMLAVLQEECDRRQDPIPYFGIGVAAIKQTATGKGNANKEAMVLAAVKRWPDLGSNISSDEADARWIAVTGLKEIGK